MERGHVGHASTAEHAALYEEVLRVPLFVYDARQSSAVYASAVQGDDVFGAVAGALGSGGEANAAGPVAAALRTARSEQSNALPVRPTPLVFHSARGGYRTPREWADHTVSAVIDGRHKVIVERFGAERTLAFDFESDPGERNPITLEPHHEALCQRWLQRSG